MKKVYDMDLDTLLIPEIVANDLTQDKAEVNQLGARARAMWSNSKEFRDSFLGAKDMREVMKEWFLQWMSEYRTLLTVIVSERTSPFPPVSPWPLIYDLDFSLRFEHGDGVVGVSAAYHDEILQRVAEERLNEIGAGMFEPASRDNLDAIKAGLELHFAFAGPTEIVADWREP
jgi:hypothetical protein